MDNSKINEFAHLLVQHVRDAAIRSCDLQLKPDSRSPIAKRWREEDSNAAAIIPDCVDETLFQLLQAVDQGVIRLSFHPKASESIDLSEVGLGELSGSFMASGGWRTEFSHERINDDFADLT